MDTQDLLVGTKDKIQILLNEYSSLRNEVVQRTNNLYQIIGIGAVLLSLIFARSYGEARFWIAVAIGVVVITTCGFLIHHDVEKLARRLRALEKEINHRAGEELLIWETVWGGLAATLTLNPRKSP